MRASSGNTSSGSSGRAAHLPARAVLKMRESATLTNDEATYGPVSADVPLVVTARRDGEVLGAADGHIRREQAYLARLIVVADHRGEGVGSRLLDAFEAAAREAGAREVILRTIAGGPADVFYRGRGWVEYDRLPAWRPGRDFV